MSKKKNRPLEYIGKASIPHVPARDLSAEEVEKYGGVERLVKTGLYAEYILKEEATEEAINGWYQETKEDPVRPGDNGGN